MNQVNFTLKILLPIAFIPLSIGQLVAWMNPANGTEISIYTSTPVLFWVSLIFAFVLGLLIIIRHLTKEDLQKHVLVSGILLLAYASLSFISLFIVRGYYIYILLTGDVGYHYGVVDKILLTGFESVHYPLLHIQTAISQLFTGIPMTNMINITTVVFTIVLIIGINLLVRQIIDNRYIHYMSYFISLLVPFGCSIFTTGNWSFSMFVPFLAGFCITPYIIYCIFQLSDSEITTSHVIIYTVLLSMLLLAALFFHPVIYVVCFAFLILSVLVFLLYSKRKLRNIVKKVIPYSITIGITLSVFLVWTLIIMKSGTGIVHRLLEMVENIFTSFIPKNATLSSPVISNSITVESLGGTISSGNTSDILSIAISSLQDLGVLGIIDIGLRYVGLITIFCLMLVLFLPKVLSCISKLPFQKVFCMYLLAGIAVIYTLVSLFIDMSVQMGRILPFVILSGIVISSIALGKLLETYNYAQSPKQKNTSIIVFSCLLLILIPLALGSYYPTMTESLDKIDQNTHALMKGNDFYLTHGNFSYHQESLGIHYQRMVEATYHSAPIMQNGNAITYYHIFGDTVPIHFGYQEKNHLNQSLSGDTYLSINENIVTYYSVTPIAKYISTKYTINDFYHLEYDSSVQKYYSNPNMRLYIII